MIFFLLINIKKTCAVRLLIFGMISFLFFSESESSFAQEQGIAHSPYRFSNLVSDPAVTADFHQLPRDASNWRNWSSTPFADWSNLEVIRHVVRSRWGPRFITFPAPSGVFNEGPDWQRKRIFAAAALLIGQYRYAHHHMQVWDVPNDPQWITDRMTPGRGIDCSDFTTWMYDYGLGVRLSSSVLQQAETRAAPVGATPFQVSVQRIGDVTDGFPHDYNQLTATLQPGDLLFIRHSDRRDAPIAHVIVWLGDYASDDNGKDAHLILDSHGSEVYDSAGHPIPSGPAIRPFREKSWYFRCYDHALRILPLRKR